jgi:hypothetical protein
LEHYSTAFGIHIPATVRYNAAMKFLRLGMAMVLVLCVTACTTTTKSTPVAWRFLAKGFDSRIQKPRRVVLRTATEWRAFWALHNPANPTNKPPVVDFKKEMVVAVMMGLQKVGAHDLEVVQVEMLNNRTRVLVIEYEPALGARPRKGGTTPYQIVAIPRSASKPRFVDVTALPKAPWQPLRIDNGPGFLTPSPKRSAGGTGR